MRFLVAPNTMHHLSLGDWAAAYPSAKVLAPAGLRKKRPELRIDVELSDVMDVGQSPAIELLLAHGIPKLEEFVFFHRPSRTLLLTDLAFNIQGSDGLMSKLMLRLNDSYMNFGPSRVCRAHITEPAMARSDVETILAMKPERAIVAHGEILGVGATAAIERGYAWLRS